MNCESAQRVQSVFVVSRLSAANTRKTDDSLGFKWGSAMLKTCENRVPVLVGLRAAQPALKTIKLFKTPRGSLTPYKQQSDPLFVVYQLTTESPAVSFKL